MPAEIDQVVFYEKPVLKYERILRTSIATAPRSWRSFIAANRTWLGSRLAIRGTIAKRLGVPRERISFADHHASHAASAYFCSPYDDAAVLTIDGVGEWACATWGIGTGTSLELRAEQRFPHSLGLLFSTFTAFLGFEVNDGEYKVMGLAPYGRPRYLEEIRRVAQVGADGSLELDLDHFAFHTGTERPYNERFVRIFGEPFAAGDDALEQRRADVAASIQRFTEDAVVAMARHVRSSTGREDLCMAGGVALNTVANWRVAQEAGFRSVWIQPAAGDSGGALGAALLGWHGGGGQRRLRLDHAYWGDVPGVDHAALERSGLRHEVLDEDRLIDRTVDLLAGGEVVAWCRGRFEWGPRALGHRSILADPRRAEMKDVVNERVKFREPFRPFAASIVPEAAADMLSADPGLDPLRFMLYVVPVREGARETIPAVTHVDGTCRAQVVHDATEPVYAKLIRRFGQATGVPAVLNTSFNLRGEPIVLDALGALATFARSDINALVLEDTFIEKR